jgi:hypothetical protein
MLQTLQRRNTYGQALSIMSSFPQRGQCASFFSVIFSPFPDKHNALFLKQPAK